VNVSREILSTLAYFDLFDYPLSKPEIYKFLQRKISHQEFEDTLGCLLEEMKVFRLGDFFSLHHDPALSARRKKGNDYARQLLVKAERYGAIISKFPFVEGVAISGSLSKNFASDDADIDYFIITKRNRLWLARSFLHLYKKLSYLSGKQHFLCMNYFVDEESLTIREKNIYTATELVTLMPLAGNSSFERLFQANTWTSLFLPNSHLRINNSRPVFKPFFTRFCERLMSNSLGSYIDKLLMKLTVNSWSNKTRKEKKNDHGFVLCLDAGRHYAKPDPKKFQQNLLDSYSYKIGHLASLYEEEMQSIDGL